MIIYRLCLLVRPYAAVSKSSASDSHTLASMDTYVSLLSREGAMSQILYHYTTTEALVGILTNKCVWLTDYRFVNDSQEFEFAKVIADNTLRKVDWESRRKRFEAVSDKSAVLQYFDAFTNRFQTSFGMFAFEKQYGFSPYVFSLSAKKDSLSQWRAYGSGQVCIEFDAERLSSTTDTKLISVRYKEPGDTDSDLKGAIEYYIDGKLDDLRSKRAIDPETVMEGARDLSLYVRSKNSTRLGSSMLVSLRSRSGV